MSRGRRRIRPTGGFVLGFVVLLSLESALGQTRVWERVFAGAAGAVAVDRNGGSIYVATQTGLAKYDTSGNELWVRPPLVTDVGVDVAGNVYATGLTGGATNFRKYDPNGNQLWSFVCNLCDYSYNYLAVDGTAIYLAGGQNDGSALLGKFDSNGQELWTRQFGAGVGSSTSVSDVAVDGFGGIYVVGGTNGPLPGQNHIGSDDMFVRKYDANGALLWTRQFGTALPDFITGVTADASGVYVVGTLPEQNGGIDAFVRKYDANGTLVWTREFGSSANDFPQGIARHASGTIYVVGHAGAPFGTPNAFWRAFDANGGDHPLFTDVGFHQYAQAVAVDISGGVYIAGFDVFGSTYVGFLQKFMTCASSPPGDVNSDCLINCQDLALVRAAFGKRPGQPGWNARADVVTDNVIDLRDVAFVAQKIPAGTVCQ